MAKKLFIITGPKESGKSTFCIALASRLRSEGKTVKGLLSPAVVEHDQKIAIDLIDLASGERRRLATQRVGKTEGIFTDSWQFNGETLQWGNEILAGLGEHETIILDELGQLEFERGLGFTQGMQLLDEGRFHRAYIVIRPQLLEQACARWSVMEVIDITRNPSLAPDAD